MIQYVAFLRGINVTGHKMIKMADLKAMMDALGFENVTTYIQSGNVFFKSIEKDQKKLETKIKKGIFDTFKFDVPVLVWPSTYIASILKHNPYFSSKTEESRLYYTMLSEIPKPELVDKLNTMANDIDLYTVYDNIVFIHVKTKYSDSKFSNNLIEKVLKVEATTRNHATMVKMSGG